MRIAVEAIKISLVFLCACGSVSVEDFRKKGERAAQSLTDDLRQIHTQDDLKAAIPKLRRKFLKISALLLEARHFHENYPEAEVMASSAAGDELFAELARLYELPGGRELIESAQAKAIEQLK